MTDILVFLQNAYYRRGRALPRKVWEYALWKSHTGRRLREMLPSNCEVYIENASPKWGVESGACFPADTEHIQVIVKEQKPKIILACGTVAQAGLSELDIEFIPVPHPAWRLLSKEKIMEIRELLEAELYKEE